MPETLTYTGTLVIRTCWCGIQHAIPSGLNDQVNYHGMAAYCPLGHKWVTSGETSDARAKRLARQLEATRDVLHAEERSHSATRGHLTRAKKREKRIAAGVCPCCNRTFQNLARHMSGQHPDFPR